MNVSTYPVRVDAQLDPGLNRWLWLVKWVLVIPHYVMLVFLRPAFVACSVVAFPGIVFTGRYPPFTLAKVPEYPTQLEVDYPEHLSRGLVLVKWWLLAIPHYLVIAFFAGGGAYPVNEATTSDQSHWNWGSGLIGLLVLIAAVALLVTGRYPP